MIQKKFFLVLALIGCASTITATIENVEQTRQTSFRLEEMPVIDPNATIDELEAHLKWAGQEFRQHMHNFLKAHIRNYELTCEAMAKNGRTRDDCPTLEPPELIASMKTLLKDLEQHYPYMIEQELSNATKADLENYNIIEQDLSNATNAELENYLEQLKQRFTRHQRDFISIDDHFYPEDIESKIKILRTKINFIRLLTSQLIQLEIFEGIMLSNDIKVYEIVGSQIHDFSTSNIQLDTIARATKSYLKLGAKGMEAAMDLMTTSVGWRNWHLEKYKRHLDDQSRHMSWQLEDMPVIDPNATIDELEAYHEQAGQEFRQHMHNFLKAHIRNYELTCEVVAKNGLTRDDCPGLESPEAIASMKTYLKSLEQDYPYIIEQDLSNATKAELENYLEQLKQRFTRHQHDFIYTDDHFSQEDIEPKIKILRTKINFTRLLTSQLIQLEIFEGIMLNPQDPIQVYKIVGRRIRDFSMSKVYFGTIVRAAKSYRKVCTKCMEAGMDLMTTFVGWRNRHLEGYKMGEDLLKEQLNNSRNLDEN